MNGKWFPIVMIYLFGLFGTAALGMMGPLAADIGRLFDVPGSTVGVAIAGQLMPLAFAGLLMGWLIDRLGPKRLLLAGLFVMGGCSLVNATATDFNVLRASLLLEGIALVALLTSGQSLLMITTTGRQQIQALTLWSTVMPVGYAFGLLLASPYAGDVSWQKSFYFHAGIAVFLLLGSPWLSAVRASSGGGSLLGVLRNSRVVRYGLSLSLSALAGIGSSAVGALYFNKVHGVDLSLSAQIMAIASLCGIAGSVVIGTLLTKGWRSSALSFLILVTAVLGGVAFYWPSGYLPLAITGAILQQLCVGGFIALVYSLLPRALPDVSMAGSAAGLVGQITGIGAGFSAPLFFAALDIGQWLYFIVILAFSWGVSFLLLPPERQLSANALDAI